MALLSLFSEPQMSWFFHVEHHSFLYFLASFLLPLHTPCSVNPVGLKNMLSSSLRLLYCYPALLPRSWSWFLTLHPLYSLWALWRKVLSFHLIFKILTFIYYICQCIMACGIFHLVAVIGLSVVNVLLIWGCVWSDWPGGLLDTGSVALSHYRSTEASLGTATRVCIGFLRLL